MERSLGWEVSHFPMRRLGFGQMVHNLFSRTGKVVNLTMRGAWRTLWWWIGLGSGLVAGGMTPHLHRGLLLSANTWIWINSCDFRMIHWHIFEIIRSFAKILNSIFLLNICWKYIIRSRGKTFDHVSKSCSNFEPELGGKHHIEEEVDWAVADLQKISWENKLSNVV